MTDRQANTDEEKKKMDKDKSCKPTKKALKSGDGIPDTVKGVVAVTAKRPEMNDPTTVRTESDEEDMESNDDWQPPSQEEVEKAKREK
ncbi:hypothetical protein CHS0354_035025 [Potamilus streckersoni]|nr:hypothetical protein CHS0354_035025 [Potamilus streckersoni]